MWQAGLRIVFSLFLACAATIVVMASPLGAAALLDLLFGGSSGLGRGGGVAVLVLLTVFPMLLSLMLLWLPVVLFSRNRGYRARERALLSSPVAFLAVVLASQGAHVLAGKQPDLSFDFLPAMIFFAPALMIATAFFFYFDRLFAGDAAKINRKS